MSRHVLNNQTPRCARCRFPPRWCICAGGREVVSPLQVDVLMHEKESWRPTSTGHLVHRVVSGARLHVYVPEEPPARETVALPGRELWVLHPRGEPVPAGVDPAGVQVVLIDGSWSEAARMATHVAGWGRSVCLPPAGPSRNGLRRQDQPGKYATAEALIQLFDTLGLAAAAEALRQQFELHVYAGLRTRGARVQAAEFLATTRLPELFPGVIAELHRVRPIT
jgi:DTW domain-containing protein YfiP